MDPNHSLAAFFGQRAGKFLIYPTVIGSPEPMSTLHLQNAKHEWSWWEEVGLALASHFLACLLMLIWRCWAGGAASKKHRSIFLSSAQSYRGSSFSSRCLYLLTSNCALTSNQVSMQARMSGTHMSCGVSCLTQWSWDAPTPLEGTGWDPICSIRPLNRTGVASRPSAHALDKANPSLQTPFKPSDL